MEFIGLDIHRHCTVAARMAADGSVQELRRLSNEELPAYLQGLAAPPAVGVVVHGELVPRLRAH